MNNTELIKKIEEINSTLGYYLSERKWLVFWILHPEINALDLRSYRTDSGDSDCDLKDISFNLKRWCEFEKYCKRIRSHPEDIFHPRYKMGRSRSRYDFEGLYDALDLSYLDLDLANAHRDGWYARPSNPARELLELNQTIRDLYYSLSPVAEK